MENEGMQAKAGTRVRNRNRGVSREERAKSGASTQMRWVDRTPPRHY